jgi:hypothetical protein
MNVLETLIIIFLIFLFIMTAVQEPVITFKFTKAYVSSGFNAVKKTTEIIKGFKAEKGYNETI